VSGDDEQRDETPRRFRTLRPNPARDVLPWVAAVVGVVQAVRGGIELGHGASPVHLLIGLGLVVLGVVVGLVNRWQARRGH